MKKGEDESNRIQRDEDKIMEIIGRLPPEYVRKVLVFANTLEILFREKCSAKQ